jgi:hypothetical protein
MEASRMSLVATRVPAAAVLPVIAILALAGCGGSSTTTTTTDTTATASGSVPETTASAPSSDAAPGAAPGTMPVRPDVTPAHIEVQHILIGFAGSIPGKGITRTQAEARQLAYEVLAKARQGENYDQLVREYTDDQAPGVYQMANTGVPVAEGEFKREGMVPAFGNVGFELSPGNIGIADYDPSTSPYGWHIIKRLR